jgi:hypothetical protein
MTNGTEQADELRKLRAERAKVIALIPKWDAQYDDEGGSTGLGYAFAANDLAETLGLTDRDPR